jgi:hypothetical protein
MKPISKMMQVTSCLTMLGLTLVAAIPASAEELILKKGTDVHLLFATPLSSKTAHDGDKVRFTVEDPVMVDGKEVIKEGTPVIGTVTKVQKRGRYGVNAHIQMVMNPIRTVAGNRAPLGFKTKGQDVSSRTGEAAGATIGGAAILGPVGLVGGYFIVGKNVNAKPGDKMTVDIDKDTVVHVR